MIQKNTICLLILLFFCANYANCQTEETIDSLEMKIKKMDTGIVISTPIFSKNFVKKNNYSTKHKELYLKHQGKTYFIKFCRSQISRKELEKHLRKKPKNKNITLGVTLSTGYLDICDGNYDVQSRMGDYALIHRIVEK